jgi:hypothetical protein
MGEQNGDTVVDQYMVPGETMHIPEPIQVPSVTTVMENQVNAQSSVTQNVTWNESACGRIFRCKARKSVWMCLHRPTAVSRAQYVIFRAVSQFHRHPLMEKKLNFLSAMPTRQPFHVSESGHPQVYMEPKQVTVKVPRTIMEDVEVTYQVCLLDSICEVTRLVCDTSRDPGSRHGVPHAHRSAPPHHHGGAGTMS